MKNITVDDTVKLIEKVYKENPILWNTYPISDEQISKVIFDYIVDTNKEYDLKASFDEIFDKAWKEHTRLFMEGKYD